MGGKTRSTQVTGEDVSGFAREIFGTVPGGGFFHPSQGAQGPTGVDLGFEAIPQELFGQIGEALRTGGVGAQIPIIQQALSQARTSLGQGQEQTSNELARVGLTGTPFGQRALAEQRATGEQQIAGIPTQFAQQLAGQAPQLTTALLTAMLGAFAGAGRQRARGGPFST